jgi:hypothetical protein
VAGKEWCLYSASLPSGNHYYHVADRYEEFITAEEDHPCLALCAAIEALKEKK